MTLDLTSLYNAQKPPSFGQVMGGGVRSVLLNIWEFAARQPTGVYALVDFDSHSADAFVILDKKAYSPLELHRLKKYKFDPSPERREAYLHYLQNDVEALEKLWATHKKLLPRRMWMGVAGALEHENITLDYTPKETPLPSLEEAMKSFKREVLHGQWPNPLLGL